MTVRFRIDADAFLNAAASGSLGSNLIARHYERLIRSEAVTGILQTMNEDTSSESFCESALSAMGITLSVTERDPSAASTGGPLLVVSNHPFGGVEGMALLQYLNRHRPDVKVLVNSFLQVFTGLSESFIGVNPFQSTQSRTSNAAAIRSAISHVAAGGVLAIFPAGEVSRFHLRNGCITDPPWNATAAFIARQTGADVMPVYFEGANSLLFQAAGLVHPAIRTALLPRELFNKKGATLYLNAGSRIPNRRLAKIESLRDITSFLRARTYALAGQNSRIALPSRAASLDDLAVPMSPIDIAAELNELDANQCLVRHNEMSVYLADAKAIPNTLSEIGRLRELTFREVGEGTGRSTDIDRFDSTYLHLILFDEERQAIAGAYRLGPTDQIVARHGFKGLYTSTLFRFSAALKSKLLPALELGRSFICPEYQRKPLSLALLWKGIGRFVCQNPQYRILFGPVSISGAYKESSRRLMVSWFHRHCIVTSERKQITPRNPIRRPLLNGWDMNSVLNGLFTEADLSSIISEIEDDAKGLPVLVRQYLGLNGRILGFNLDEAFSDVVDGMILVDLTLTRPEVLSRYMGKENVDVFLKYQQRISSSIAS